MVSLRAAVGLVAVIIVVLQCWISLVCSRSKIPGKNASELDTRPRPLKSGLVTKASVQYTINTDLLLYKKRDDAVARVRISIKNNYPTQFNERDKGI